MFSSGIFNTYKMFYIKNLIARRQSMKNAFLSAQYDITMNKNNMGYRYKNNNFAQQFSLQHYFNSQICNDLLFQQQQQQLHQLSTLPDISSHLFQLQNNIVNYNSNPSFIFQSMKDPFCVNQCCSQVQDLGYSPIGLSSQVQGSLLSHTHQFSKQYPQNNLNNLYNTSNNDSHLQNVDKENINENINENSIHIENMDKCEKQYFNKEANKESCEVLKKDKNKNKQDEELNQLKSKINNNEPINNDNVEINDNKKESKERIDDEKIVKDNIDEEIVKEKIEMEMEIDIDKQSSHSHDEKEIEDINSNNEKEESSDKDNNKDKKSTFFNFIASPPFNDSKDLNKKINDEFTKPIQLQSPQSQSPIPNVKISRHIPLQLQSPQSQSQTPRQIKSPTFVIPSKKDNVLTSPIEETKEMLISPPTNDLNKFIKMNEKLKNSIDISEISDDQDEKDIDESEHKKSASKIIDNKEENENKDDIKNAVKLLNDHPSVFSESSENLLKNEQKVDKKNNENEKKVENEKVEEIVENNQDKVSIIDKLEAMDISSKDNSKHYDNDSLLEEKKEDKEKDVLNEKKKEFQNQMEVDNFNTTETITSKENLNQNEDPNIDTSKVESLKNNDLSLENNNLNVLYAQPNTDIQLNQNPNYLNTDSEKYLNNNQLYPPRVNTLNPRFQRYLQQQQLMKSRSYSNISINYNSQGNPLYFPPKFNNSNYGIPNSNQIIPPYYPLQNNKNLPPYPLYPNMMKQPNNHYINYPPHRPYSYPFSNIYSNNYKTMSYNYQYFGYNNNRLNNVNPNLMTQNNKPYGSSSTSTPIKIPPLSTFYKKDSSSQYLTQTLYNPINKRPSRLKIKSTLDKSSKSNWNNRKRYLNMVELDGVNYGNFSLKYLNFFLLKDKKETDNHGMEDCITIAELIIPNDVSKTVDITSISEDKLPDYQKIFDKYIQSTSFISLKVNFSFPKFLNEYLFMNTFIFESNVFRRVKCTTTVYSFGKKILETDEICNASLKENKYILNFEFVNKFFTDFLEKFQEFKTYDEIQLALENLAIMQVKIKSYN